MVAQLSGRLRQLRLSALTIGAKLSLLCLAFALPIVTLLGFFVSDRQQISSLSRQELHGAQSLEPLRALRHDLTVARAIALTAAIDGDTASVDRLKQAERPIDADFSRLARSSGLSDSGSLDRLHRRWQALVAQPLQPVYTDSAFQAILNQLAAFTEEMGSSSPVVRDQEQNTFWLGQGIVRTLPGLDAIRTQLVDTADTAARRKIVESHERVELQALSTQLNTLLEDTADVYQRADPPADLRAALQVLLSSHQVLLDEVKYQLTNVDSPYLSPTALVADSAAAEEASLRLWQLSSRQFKVHVESRIRGLDRDTGAAIVTVFVVLSVTSVLAFLMIRNIRRPLRQAADVARRISNGHIAELPAERKDEIGVMLHAMRDVMRDLQDRARLDPLTGLPNRRGFTERVSDALAERRPSQGVALLFVDLDHFKKINDGMGHAAGDILLVGLAARLRSSARPEDTIARFGGDEFTILLRNLDSVQQAVRCAERVAEGLRKPFSLGDRELFISASIGIGYTTDPETLPGDLLREADVALYRSKADGRGRHTIFVEALAEGSLDSLQLESDLRRAVDDDELLLDYQPIISFDSGTAVGVEALLRWRRPDHGLISPGTFIPIAEANGLIESIGLWGLGEACRWAATQNMLMSGGPVFVSVNLSRRQLHQDDLAQVIANVLTETGLQPHLLQLEITETAIMENEEVAIAVLSSLQDLGVKIYVDDFGSGYSSLRALQKLPVDGIKIDLSFIDGLAHDTTKQVLVRSIIAMAEALELPVVAEGVETVAQHVFLKEAGCQLAQGFLYCQPVPAERLKEWAVSHGDLFERLAPEGWSDEPAGREIEPATAA
jgi:diguanylate cyclase (GGDEF)-like protein